MIVKGRMPKELALEKFLTIEGQTKEENHLMFILQEIENSQHKIDFNLEKNKTRRDRLKHIMYAIIILMPIYLVIAFFAL
jgi:transcription initiation factor IIF auxiliary subunit